MSKQFFFGEEDYRFVKNLELRTVFVDCFLLTVTLADGPVQEPLEIVVMLLNGLFFHAAGSTLYPRVVRSLV